MVVKEELNLGTTKLKPVTIYLTTEEYNLVTKEAFEHGTSLNYYLRALIDQYSPVKLPPLPKQGAPKSNLNAKAKTTVKR
jgi:hypothetical protein